MSAKVIDAEKREQTYQLLNEFYQSFFSDVYNELNIHRYLPVRDAIANVIHKFIMDDHPMAFAGKLVMYIQTQIAFSHLRLSKQQLLLLHRLEDLTKNIDLTFVYTSPLDSNQQFVG
ncbi:hypothetical protein [Lactobacillus gigeriorum]|uniref:Bacteriocin immunity protein n=1 Tax=Lactobacillus gigeriorum DSM 23908 = CRBIP 24.85 TaxID=1423751 RepID=I7KPS1_9LACO|nr:hypothetical protein [Lactobacillus gigeriorum]KRN11780.1 hypothetical protein FC38_GL000554 [Lactobacillus gigeriorum DSM 23908 = CRBIP 24.85]CCI87479.1 Putative uncharacterized protein [Lactobacillus gigeriorum DSM 23908 = CRBIP 24.85]